MMSNDELNEKLKQLKIEDYIWILYIGIIALSLYSNYLEKKYYIDNDKISKERYLNITTLIFIILVIVYFYFFKSSYDDFKKIKPCDSKKKKELVTLSFIGSTLILLSGIIFLYISLENKDLDVEIAFN